MKIIIGDLLTQTDVLNITQSCNCMCVQGGGLAGVIRKKYPQAFEADCETMKADFKKLGTFSRASTDDGKIIYNVYSQYQPGANTEYGALYNGLLDVAYTVNADGVREFGIPYRMGCGIGGAVWAVVQRIIEHIEMVITKYNLAGDYKTPEFKIICYDIDGLSLTPPKIDAITSATIN